MTGMRNVKHVVQSSQKRFVFHSRAVRENSEKFFIERPFPYPVVIVQRRLRPPTDKYGAGNLSVGVIHYAAKFVPVFHVGKIEIFHRRAGYYHSVEIPVLYVVESEVKPLQIGTGHVGGGV